MGLTARVDLDARMRKLTHPSDRTQLDEHAQSALARILLSDATDKVCAEQFIARGHDVDSKPGLSKEELIKIIHEYDGASHWLIGGIGCALALGFVRIH